jgi:hypothetical protein
MSPLRVVSEQATSSTWAPVALSDVLSGGYSEPEPDMLARIDGRALLYASRVHALHAEPEGLKTWLALKACAERLAIADDVLYIDFEDGAASIVRRLLDLGANPKAVEHHFTYIRPDEPLTDATIPELEPALARKPSVAVLDGITEAFVCQGLNPLDNADVATWLALLPRRLVCAGAAVLLLDHVVKDREQRGRYALGAQHKLAGVDVAYSLRLIEPFAPGRDGTAAIRVEKDRPGRVREFAPDGQAATLHANSTPDGVRITLEPPEDRAHSFRPTVLMERISHAVEADPGLSKRAIRETVRGKTSASDLALELLVAEGFIEPRRDGQATRHYPLKSYREDDDNPNRDPVTQPRPDRDPVTGETDRDPVTAPLKGHTGTGHAPTGTPNNGNRDPDPDTELARINAKFGDTP